jgi:hypothetical protein
MLATELTVGSDTALDSVVADVDKIKQSAVATRRWLRGRSIPPPVLSRTSSVNPTMTLHGEVGGHTAALLGRSPQCAEGEQVVEQNTASGSSGSARMASAPSRRVVVLGGRHEVDDDREPGLRQRVAVALEPQRGRAAAAVVADACDAPAPEPDQLGDGGTRSLHVVNRNSVDLYVERMLAKHHDRHPGAVCYQVVGRAGPRD